MDLSRKDWISVGVAFLVIAAAPLSALFLLPSEQRVLFACIVGVTLWWQVLTVAFVVGFFGRMLVGAQDFLELLEETDEEVTDRLLKRLARILTKRYSVSRYHVRNLLDAAKTFLAEWLNEDSRDQEVTRLCRELSAKIVNVTDFEDWEAEAQLVHFWKIWLQEEELDPSIRDGLKDLPPSGQ